MVKSDMCFGLSLYDMDENEYKNMKEALVTIAAEFYRLQTVLERVLSKLDAEDANKYRGRIEWFAKRVNKAMSDANMQIVDLKGETYDAGMAVTPVNIDDFDAEEPLIIRQMTEPLIMCGSEICKTGTVILGRKEA